MKKTKFMATILAFMLILGTVLPVNASTSTPHFTIELSDCIQSDSANDLVSTCATPINKSTLTQGSTRYYYTSEGNYFTIAKNTKVTFKVNLKSKAKVTLGYQKKGGSLKYTYSGTSSNPSATFTLSEAGSYRFYIRNYSEGTITITGGSFTFS